MRTFDDGARCRRCAGSVVPTGKVKPGTPLVQEQLPIVIHSVRNNHSSFYSDDGQAAVELKGCRVEATLILPQGEVTSEYHIGVQDIVFNSGVPDIETTIRRFIKGMCRLIDGSDPDAD
ncbi:hypothetical protein MKY95_23225 [Paenibacillus sp. FSL P4-0176]|uniref:hypothetical protein n=1 Tax=Paenibacillus sp. FSL P4-0176 TaxID=2921631 RepID=UPI0030CE4E02